MHTYDDNILDHNLILNMLILPLGVHLTLFRLSHDISFLYSPSIRHNANMPVSLPFLDQLLRQSHRSLVFVRKEEINLLERHSSCLGVKEVDNRCKTEISAHEDQVSLPLQPVDNDGGDHDHKEVLEVFN